MTNTANPETDSALPAGWKWARLGELCTIRTGKKDVNSGNPNGQYPFFTCARKHTYSDAYSFDTEAVLIAGNGDVGHVQYYSGKFEAYQRTYVLNEWNGIEGLFLFFMLKAKLKETVSKLKLGNTMPYIKLGMLKEFHIPLPPLSEQERIARVLDECLASIARAKDAAELQLEAAVALPGAYLRQALPAEGGTFHRVPFKSVCTLEYGTSLRRKDRINGPYPVMGSNGVSGYHNTYLIQGPAIIVGRKGSAGEVNYVKSNCFPIDTTYYVKLVDSKQTDLVYLYYLLKSLDLPSLRGGSAIPGLNRNDVYSKHQLPLPPLDEQRRIASDLDARISAAGMLVSRIREQLDAIDALPGAYLRQAFAGEI